MGASSPSGPELPGSDEPLVAVAAVKGAQRLRSVCALAAERGLSPGQALADARALCRPLRVVEADPQADAALMAGVVDWCRRFTPLSAPDGPDGAVLDVGGASHLFGGEADLVAAVEGGLRRQGLACRAAVASTPEAAWAFARFGAVLGSDGAATIVPAPADPGFEPLAAALPLAALRLDAEAVAGLARAGLVRVGDLLGRPRAPIAARFGAGVLHRLDGLMGLGLSPIAPRFPAPRCVAERRFAAGLTRAEAIEAALLPLCRHLCASLARRGEGARTVEASFFRVDGAVKRLRLGTSRPTRDPEALFGLFRERIAALGEDGLDTGYGFDLIRLAVAEGERLDARQVDAAQDGFDPEGVTAAADLADLADRLGARLGLRRVLRLAARDSHIPECAVVALPVSAEAPIEGADDPALCRPIRLFERPEPIDTVASVPDGPPVRFRWRRVMHDVAAIEGPERIAPQWWTGEGELTRDYFRAEDRDGRRYWLFREGLFGRETDRPRWFLHGLFG